MRASILIGSRNPLGQSARAADALMDGLRAGGCECSPHMLAKLNLQRCRQCNDNGWGTCQTQGTCVIEDDLAGIVQDIRSSGVVVLVTPVYFGDLSESLRAFLDRLRRTCRYEPAREGIAGKPAVGICVAGGGGGGAASCSVQLERILQTCRFDVVDLVPVRRQNLEMKLPLLRATGQWLASCPSSNPPPPHPAPAH